MLTKIKYLLHSVAYGLAIALVIVILVPNLRSKIQWLDLTQNVIQPEAMSFAYAVQQAAPSVVNIYSLIQDKLIRQKPQLNDLGSGVIMTSNGHILTNYHVIDKADLIYVHLQDGRQFKAEVLGLDPVTDLALLKIDAVNLPAIPQDPDLEAKVGDIVLAIGNPLNLGQTITQGIISATGKRGLGGSGQSYGNFLQMDAAINIGNSGGALVNSRGKLVGINTAKAQKNVQGIFFAIPYQLAKDIMLKLLEDGEVVRGYLGLNGEAINHAGLPVNSSVESIAGIKVMSVDPLGPAWNGGLQKGDILLAVNGDQLASFEQLLNLIENIKPGNTITLTVSRDKQLVTKEIRVGRLEISN